LALAAWLVTGGVWLSGLRWLDGGSAGLAQAQSSDLESKKIVPFVPTPQEVVERMLELAQVKKGDVVYDLGSGDGRILIAAARDRGSARRAVTTRRRGRARRSRTRGAAAAGRARASLPW